MIDRAFPGGALRNDTEKSGYPCTPKTANRKNEMTKGFKEITLEEKEGIKIISLTFNDVLDRDDYELFVPQLEGFMKHGDRVRLLVELENFRGLTMGALWEETKFSYKHFNDIDRLAVVGENRTEKILTQFARPFTRAEVRFFNTEETEKAREWLREKD